MTSELKSATSRANGAKSNGPKTAEGREKASHNSLTHGFTAKKTVVLSCENQEQFEEMIADYAETYQPGCPVEMDLVAEMVACRWRILRLRMMETALMDSELQRELPEPETSTDPGYRMAFAFRRLVDESRVISLVSRHESRLHRIHERSHHTLRDLQHSRLTHPTTTPTPMTTPKPTTTPTLTPATTPTTTPITTYSPSVSAGAPEPTPAPIQPEPPLPAVAVPTDEKSRNEPTPPVPSAATKNRQRLSIVRYRGIRIIRFRQSKNA